MQKANSNTVLLGGNWQHSECAAFGFGIPNRVIEIERDTTLQLAIEAWVDNYFDLSSLHDTTLYNALMNRGAYYLQLNLDSSYKYAQLWYAAAQKLHSPAKEAYAGDFLGVVLASMGNGEKAVELFFKSLQIKKALSDLVWRGIRIQ